MAEGFSNKKVGNSVFYVKDGVANSQQSLPADVQQHLNNLIDIMNTFTNNEIPATHVIKQSQLVYDTIKEANKTFEKEYKAAPLHERKTSFLKEAYETISAGLSKALDLFKNLNLSKGKDPRFGDLDKEIKKKLKNITNELKDKLKNLNNLQEAEKENIEGTSANKGILKRNLEHSPEGVQSSKNMRFGDTHQVQFDTELSTTEQRKEWGTVPSTLSAPDSVLAKGESAKEKRSR